LTGAPTFGDPHLRYYDLAMRTRTRQHMIKII
jgi:hypothetical protein